MSSSDERFYAKVFPGEWPVKEGGGGVLPYPKALYYNSKFFEKILSLKAMYIYLGLLVCTNHKKEYPECWHTHVQIETLSRYTSGKVSSHFTMLRSTPIFCPICEQKIADGMIKARSNGRGWDCDLTPGIEAARHLQRERVKDPTKFDRKMKEWLSKQISDKKKQAAIENITEYHIEQGHQLHGKDDQTVPRFTPKRRQK